MAAAGFRSAAAALLATRPAIHPLALSEASGRPNRTRVTTPAVNPDAAAHSVVLTAISTTRPGSTPRNSIAPAEFSAIHPIHANPHPRRTNTTLCPGSAAGIPSAENFPRRGPRIHVIDNAVTPPTT